MSEPAGVQRQGVLLSQANVVSPEDDEVSDEVLIELDESTGLTFDQA